jgi:hypothetical protein
VESDETLANKQQKAQAVGFISERTSGLNIKKNKCCIPEINLKSVM